jgi:hypothetical protein
MLEQVLVPFSDIIFGDRTGAKNIGNEGVFYRAQWARRVGRGT